VYDQNKIEKLKRKSYRTSYLDAHVRARLAFQIRAIRKDLGLSQKDFATKLSKPQSVVARLENPDAGLPSLKTLLDVAHALDIALLVQFVTYGEYLKRSEDVSPSALAVKNIHQEEAEFLYRKSSAQATANSPINAHARALTFENEGEISWLKRGSGTFPVQEAVLTGMYTPTTLQ
jgi:transcriptional regulator with XRE-family HTH domain